MGTHYDVLVPGDHRVPELTAYRGPGARRSNGLRALLLLALLSTPAHGADVDEDALFLLVQESIDHHAEVYHKIRVVRGSGIVETAKGIFTVDATADSVTITRDSTRGVARIRPASIDVTWSNGKGGVFAFRITETGVSLGGYLFDWQGGAEIIVRRSDLADTVDGHWNRTDFRSMVEKRARGERVWDLGRFALSRAKDLGPAGEPFMLAAGGMSDIKQTMAILLAVVRTQSHEGVFSGHDQHGRSNIPVR